LAYLDPPFVLAEMGPEEWMAYRRAVVEPQQRNIRQLGGYAARARKRRAGELRGENA
jgi:hypothetical protein